MSATILIVDDERTTRLALQETFSQLGYQAQVAASGDAALAILADTRVDIVILDLQMPGTDGKQVLAAAPDLAPDSAFIVLTAHPTADTAIQALRSGAYDYLRKPASLSTIIAAVRRTEDRLREQRRQSEALQWLSQAMEALGGKPPAAIQTGQRRAAEITINEQSQTASYQGNQLDLTPVEFRILRALVHRPETVLTFAELALITHNVNVDESEARALLRTHTYRLGRKLEAVGESPLQTVRGRGIKLGRRPEG